VLAVALPGVSGLELLRQLRAVTDWPGPPVILITASPHDPGVAAALRRGEAAQLVRKQFEFDRLVEALRSALVP
jgi:CheY-like chemotaxis protein